MKKINALIILDGFGSNPNTDCNAIYRSGTPYIKSLMRDYAHVEIGASGMDVGLPDGQMGNSEVGHLNMGAGRIVYQELTRVTKSIKDGDFFENEAFLKAIDNVKSNGGKLHIMGLLSDGGVHSHIEHIYAMLRLAKMQGLDKVYVHCFMDGRDVSPTSGIDFIRDLMAKMEEIGVGKIATIEGRYYAMDRDNRWERLVKAYNAIVDGVGEHAVCPVQVMQDSYDNGVTDEFILPTVIDYEGENTQVDVNDSVVFMNFRPDRAREITRAFIERDFDKFDRVKGFLNTTFVGLTRYDASFEGWEIAYKPTSLTNTLGEYLAKMGKTQLRIAETEKYAHVTFFFNGGVETPNEGEDRELIKSPSVATYDLKPEMSAYEVKDKAVELIASGKYDVMILNFANCDMVGHTGNMDAAIKAVDAVDDCLSQVIEAILKTGGQALVTADHGNADCMFEEDGSPFTAHTTNPVPLIAVSDEVKALKEGGRLCDIAPTLLEMMGLDKPVEMTGESLIVK